MGEKGGREREKKNRKEEKEKVHTGISWCGKFDQEALRVVDNIIV